MLDNCLAYFDEEQFEQNDNNIDTETARLMALDQQRLAHMFGEDNVVCPSVEQYFDAEQFYDASVLLQTLDTLDLVLLVASSIDCNFECDIQQDLDFQIGQHQSYI